MTNEDGDRPAPQHVRPDGASDDEVKAVGVMTEALETLTRARGHLYSFHQMIGECDLGLDEVVELLRGSGHDDLADELRDDLLGRNVLTGRWTFQIVEEFDDGYWERFTHHEKTLRDALTGGRRHVYEAEMKEARRTRGRPGHGARPQDGR